MKRIFSFMIIFIILKLSYGQRILQPEYVWADMIEIKQSTLLRHVLNDIPGSIVVLIPENGKMASYILARKILKKLNELPEINLEPTTLISSVVSKYRAANIGFLSFVTASMENTDEVKFTVSETSNSFILDSNIDWDAFDKRVAAIKEKYPDKLSKAIFGVVKVASIISIYHEAYRKVSKAAKISGWGFNAGGKCLSEKGDSSSAFKIGVALAYPDSVIRSFDNQQLSKNLIGFNSLMFKGDFGKIINTVIAKNLIRPAYFVDDISDIFLKY